MLVCSDKAVFDKRLVWIRALLHDFEARSTRVSEITELLGQATSGTRNSLDEVFSRLHAELKVLARSRLGGIPNQTLTATALVHELYLKLIGAQNLDLVSRRHFFACAASAMRQILVDAARASSAAKRGGEVAFVTLEGADVGDAETHTELLALDVAMKELQQVDPGLLELIHLRYFAGMSMQEIAQLSGRSERSLHRDWSCARAFLNARIGK